MGIQVTCDACGQELSGLRLERNYASDMLQRKITVRPGVTVDLRIRVGVPEPGRGTVCHECVAGAAEQALVTAMHFTDEAANAEDAAHAQASVEVAEADAEAEAAGDDRACDGLRNGLT